MKTITAIITATALTLSACAAPQATRVYGPMQLGPTRLYCGVDKEGRKYFCSVSRGKRTCTRVQACQI